MNINKALYMMEALYEPWGETRYQTGTSPTDYGYTGQMQEGDLYYYGARWYDPLLGRFLQPDTIVPSGHCIFGVDGLQNYTE
ncbi:MAG: RHS repeat-associated core domain-containing protein [Anaerolineaceae bacterium]